MFDEVEEAGFPIIIRRFFTIQTDGGNQPMRKLVMMFFVLALMLGGPSMAAYAADCGKDNMVDQVGDWFGTLGKKGMEKHQIMARRRASRLLACAKRKTQKAANEVRESSEDMKKRLGLS